MSVRAEKKAALAELLRIGRQMSNACFNLSQRTVADLAREEETGSRWTNTRETLADLQRRWDAVSHLYRELSLPPSRRNQIMQANEQRSGIPHAEPQGRSLACQLPPRCRPA